MKIDQYRADALRAIVERTVIRLQPLRVVEWASDGGTAKRVALCETTTEAEKVRESHIVGRMAAYDRLMRLV